MRVAQRAELRFMSAWYCSLTPHDRREIKGADQPAVRVANLSQKSMIRILWRLSSLGNVVAQIDQKLRETPLCRSIITQNR